MCSFSWQSNSTWFGWSQTAGYHVMVVFASFWYTLSPYLGLLFSNEALYANHIAKKAVFLGLPELGMLCMARQKDMLIIFWDDETQGDPVARPLLQVLNELLESNPDLGKFEVNEQPDMNSPMTWVTAAVRNDFKRSSFLDLNHFMPAYPKVQLGDDWQTAVDSVQDCHVCIYL